MSNKINDFKVTTADLKNLQGVKKLPGQIWSKDSFEQSKKNKSSAIEELAKILGKS